jgi:serine/threonine protein phosphatase PrpC
MIRTDRPHLLVAAQSHPGETGKNNEDAFSVSSYALEVGSVPSLLAVVADGIGGHQAGEVAARLAVETLDQRVAGSTGREPLPVLRTAVVEAGRAIQRAASAAPDHVGMGSTIAVAWEIGGKLYIVTVGDSRIYLLRGVDLHRLTIDHTWVQEALDHGIITPEEARNHPNAHVLRRHLGGAQDPQPDLRLRLRADESDARAQANQGLTLRVGDRILLCSDGLTDLVTDGEIQTILGAHPPAAATQTLVDLARARGGHDNITVIVAFVPTRQRRPRPLLAGLVLAMAVMLILVAVGMLGLWWLGLWPW